uniref:RING-type domain-containing protein n=1 Tax=Kalanchoe fedtschenkoi TaxID=63787 RepID=A0A7N0U6N7_KALFE
MTRRRSRSRKAWFPRLRNRAWRSISSSSPSERLRLVVREQRKRDLADMMKKIEAQTSAVLKQKEEEIAKAANHASQLETFLMKLQYEKQMWQLISRQNELHVIHLSNTLEQLQETAAIHGGDCYNNADNIYNPAAVEDTESCCDENEDGAVAEYEQQSSLKKMVCNVCQSRELGVVFLPCRHLCSCTVCGPMIDFCPVCQTEKKATIETLFQ